MDNRIVLQSLTQGFTLENLTIFLRGVSGKFRPQAQDLGHYLPDDSRIVKLNKVGQIDYEEGRLIVLAGQANDELTSHSGKRNQYEIAKKVLKAENLDAGVFVFYDEVGHFRFSLITANYTGTKRDFSTFRRYTYFVTPEADQNRTFIEQIGKENAFASIQSLTDAFSVDPVTKEFFRDYRRIFEEAEKSITLKWNAEQKRLYTQRFFNRLMFLAFLERKGWLTFGGSGLDTPRDPAIKNGAGKQRGYSTSGVRKDYMRALFADYHSNEEDKRATFHRSRLNTLFFQGLNNPKGDKVQSDPEYKIFQRLIGDVPYLNGGLFDKEVDDETWFFPDAIVAKILSELVYRYNFTVTESTPLDVEVAVDPEMLGKIFEELVTGRHESGSYYTPKPVVAFMCREALKGYLKTSMPAESEDALALFVDKNDPAKLRNPELALEALKAVKVCDPACGSGAYLLGMMHELLEQRECLFAAHVPDAAKIYDRKLEIIQNNLYGVDLDPFAVSIARLRLWLSLIVDFEGDNPPPLPNLDFKIESGDSLTAPDPSGGLQPDMFRQQQVKEFLSLKNEFLSLHGGSEKKKKLDQQIKELRAQIEEWAHPKGYDKSSNAFDWQVDFAEVFAPELAESTLSGRMAGVVNTTKGQMEMTAAPKEGGFDIVLANPPYVRHELLGDYKYELKPIYPEVYSGTTDLYVYFYARAHQLLKNCGVACFISSNKWLRASYGEKLRQFILDEQEMSLIVDFGELPLFQTATTYPCICLWKKQPRFDVATRWAEVRDLDECFEEGIYEHTEKVGHIIPASQFGKGKSRLTKKSSTSLHAKMKSSGQTLGELLPKQFLFGIKTGRNDVFVIDAETKKSFLKDDPKSDEIIKPVIAGDDIRKFEFHYREQYLIYLGWETDINNYPAIHQYMKRHKSSLLERAEAAQGRHPWFALTRYAANYVDSFEHPKIFVPAFATDPRFALDNGRIFMLGPAYFIATGDSYLLALLNSEVVWNYLKETLPSVQGNSLVLRPAYLQNLPIPDAPQNERITVIKLAEQAQKLHTQRRKRVEKFLREIGIEPAQSTSRNPLEQPWSLSEEDFSRRSHATFMPNYREARDETVAITEEIATIEKEIDERVKSLYGV